MLFLFAGDLALHITDAAQCLLFSTGLCCTDHVVQVISENRDMGLFESHQEGTTNKELEMELNKAEFNRGKNTEPLLLTGEMETRAGKELYVVALVAGRVRPLFQASEWQSC